MATQPVTLDSLMADFVCDMEIADDELSDSIFTCVDNYIDDLCLKTMDNENSVFESDVNDSELPFNYIIDKVLEKIDTVEKTAYDAYGDSLEKSLMDFSDENTSDPDYCEGINFDNISPEDFQLYVGAVDVDDEADETDISYTIDGGTNVDSSYDSIFNA